MRVALLPVTAAVGILLLCTAASPPVPGAGVGLAELGAQPPRGGDWTMPDLIPQSRPGTGQGDAPAPAPTAAPPSPGPTSGPTSGPTDATLAAVATGRSRATITLAAGDRGIPARMLAAYHAAANRTGTEQPGCHLPWPLLAGIGKVESGHAAGHRITASPPTAP
ncbi:hypothetical protein [Frankia tisae]|uniref:hypothetical protein n=1 Tax=Frankia tisae TaxID=2950104 RepID=UPI0021BE7C68|nr:hypothetical protein [Frankia tisae]